MHSVLFDPYTSIRVLAADRVPDHTVLQIKLACFDPNAGIDMPGKEAGELTLQKLVDASGGIRQVLLVSLGPVEKCSAEAIRRAGGTAARWLKKHAVDQAYILQSDLADLKVEGTAQAVCEGLYLGAFQFLRHKSETGGASPEILLVAANPSEGLQADIEHARIVAGAVNLARDWSHEPANIINPISLAERITEIVVQTGVKCTILDEQAFAQIGAGAILAVGKGSQTPARMIILEYQGAGDETTVQPIVLVGKALTFDTGGYSLKTTDGIVGMKYDKCGGVDVLATILAASALKLPVHLIAILAAAENMISGGAYRPDDIIKTLSGKTVEIISTDAEGRLVLADALTYAQREFHPSALIDLATLTGGVVTALGRVRCGYMSNNDQLSASLFEAGERVSEKLWRLPLDDDYAKLIKGDDADLKNSGGREAHPVIGGIFLKQFVDDQTPWAHLDIAGVSGTDKELPYCPKGATGFGVRLLLDYLVRLSHS